MKRYIVSNDRSVYEAWPDLVLTEAGKLICVFSECTHHGKRDFTSMVYVESTDRGKTWSDKKNLADPIHSDGKTYWDCPRITKLKDGRLATTSSLIMENETSKSEVYISFADAEGVHWTKPVSTGFHGIVPDKLFETTSGRWMITCHAKYDDFPKLQQKLWYSDDQGKTWSDPVKVAKDPRYNVCEASLLEVEPGVIVSFMRENSSEGCECVATKSTDNGETFGEPYLIPLAGCHRPVSGFLSTGEIMITYRYRQGAKLGWLGNWTQNTFLAVTNKETILTGDRDKQSVRIMPLNYDRSPESDLGYTGWIQFEDGEIYIVDYIKNDEEKAYIIGCSLNRDTIGGAIY